MTDLPCKHPMVRVVSRHEDAEFVECQLCGEVFDSSEYVDMEMEARGELDVDALLLSRQANGMRSRPRKQSGRQTRAQA